MLVDRLRVGMLHYGVGSEHVRVTIIDADGLRDSTVLVRVDDVAPRAERLARMLRAPTRFPPDELSQALREFSTGWGPSLMPASEALEPYDVLVVVPHHFLHDLPLQLVRTGDAAECVGNRFGLSFCSSATLFERAVARNPARADERTPPRMCVALGVDVLTGDPRYDELARACADWFPERFVVRGRDGLKSPVAQEADVICLVCHGVANAQRHDDSGLLLVADPGSRGELMLPLHLGESFYFRDLPFSYLPPEVDVAPGVHPELMTVTEVRTLVRTRARLVMLLGCSTATGQLRSGDSYASLAYQWLQAGAVSVLGHQWEADFPFVAGWVPSFLNHWVRQEKPKAIAVRDSVNEVLDQGLVDRDALHVWGAVALLGDWI